MSDFFTVKHNDRWYNIPTIMDGTKVDRDDALKRAISSKKLGKAFDTKKEAMMARDSRKPSTLSNRELQNLKDKLNRGR